MISPRWSKRPRVLIVGCGDVGARIVGLLAGRCRVYAVTRRASGGDALRWAGAMPLTADLDDARSLHRLRAVGTHILHLAPPPGTGPDDPRTRALLGALARPRRRSAARTASAGRRGSFIVPDSALAAPRRQRPPTLVYASTTGVYGDCQGALIDETRAVRPANARAQRRVAAEARIRAAGLRGVVAPRIVRVPGIYGGSRLPLVRLVNGTPALRASEDVYTSHIHADDLAAIMVRAMWIGRPQRIYHAADDTRLKMADYFDRVADAAALPRPPRISRNEAQGVLSPALLSFMGESRQLRNRRLKDELRYRLRYPTVDDFLSRMFPGTRR